jgi:cellulose synthase/poly-beta-1,6-N-acetylglucosamine synthase-like glycosyltransferase
VIHPIDPKTALSVDAQPTLWRSLRTPLMLLRRHGIFLTLVLIWIASVYAAVQSNSLLAWSAGLLYVCYDTWLIAYVAWHTRHLAQADHPSAPEPLTDTRIGVAVPCRNEAAGILQTIERLLAQDLAADKIIVIDDGSTDQTAALLRAEFGFGVGTGLHQSQRYPTLFLLSKANSGKADSLNQAIALIDTDVFVSIDADTLLAPHALRELRNAFAREPGLVAACGVLLPSCRGGATATLFGWFQRFEYLRAFLSRAAWMQANALLLVSGAFAGYRTKALQHIGGYDEHSLVEDYELIHRLHRFAADGGLDWRVRVLPMAAAITDAPNGLGPFLQQRRRWFAGFLRTQFKYRAMIGDARYGTVGTLMLPIKSADTLQPIFGLTGALLLLLFAIYGAPVVVSVLAVIGVKLLIDCSYHIWAVVLYHRWTRTPLPSGIWWRVALCTLLEPFTFQLARHLGAVAGWLYLLSRKVAWQPQRRAT